MNKKYRPKLHEVISKLMQEVGINEAELARKTDIPQPTLHRILSGATQSPRGLSLAPIANFFSVTINQLMGIDELPGVRIAGTHNSRIYGWTPIPIISWQKAAIWNKFKKKLQQSSWKAWTSTDLSVSDTAFALLVETDAMSPTFNEGTILVVDPFIKARNRDYVIVSLVSNNTTTFRQLLIDGDTKYLKSINADFLTLPMDTNNRLIGTLVQARMDYWREPVAALQVA